MRSSVAVSAYYFFLFAGIGVFWPNYGPFLRSMGVGADEAALIMSLNPLMGLFVPPLVGLLADARRARVWILRILSLAAAAAFAAWLLEPRARLAIYAVGLLYAVARAPISSLADVSAFDVAMREGTTFGRLRTWGSVGFLAAAPIGGLLLEHAGRTAMVAVATIGLAAAAACAFRLPAPSLERRPGALRASLGLLASPDHRRFLLVILLGYIGNGALDGCFSMHLQQLGHGGTYIGIAWALGVLAEVAFMWRSGSLIFALGAERLLLLALGVAAVRWVLIAFITDATWLLVLQPLHGITFGCMFVAAATMARERSPAEAPAAGQGLFTAVASAGSLMGMIGGGQLFVRGGGRTLFLAAAACAAAAALVAVGLSRRRIG